MHASRYLLGLVFLTTALFLPVESTALAGKELLKNPDFKRRIEGWFFRRHDEYKKVREPRVKRGDDKLRYCYLDVPHVSQALYLRLDQHVDIEEGKIYRVKFDLRAEESEGPLVVVISQHNKEGKPVVNGLNVRVKAGTEWAHSEILFKAIDINTDKPNNFMVSFGLFKGRVEVRNFSFTEEEDQTVTIKRKLGDLVAADTSGAQPEPAAEPDKPTEDLSKPRTWTSASGAELEGTLEQVFGGTASIKRTSDGKIFRIPLNKLSDEDRERIKNRKL
jgi:hypothetical protein